MIESNRVLAAVPLGPKSEFVGQLKALLIPGLCPFSRSVNSRYSLFTNASLPTFFLFYNLQPASQGQGCVIATT